MLRRLSIRDIVLIDALDIDFGPGLNVLTGETGAGKSILLDALGLALGARAGPGLTRVGAGHGSAAAAFEIHPQSRAAERALSHGFAIDGGELILRRVVGEDGRGKAFVNDQPASVAVLREIAEALVEIHGQHDDRGLLNPSGHRAALDAFAGLEERVAALRGLWSASRDASTALASAREAAAAAARDRDYLAHSVQELDGLNLAPGEEADLDAERRLMKQAERIVEDVSGAVSALGPHGAEASLSDALRRLQHAAPKAEGLLDPALAAVDRTLVELGEAARRLDEASQALIVDPARLEAVEERLFLLRALARKHQCAVDALPETLETLRARLADIDAAETSLATLEATAEATAVAFRAEADAIHAARRDAAGALDAAVGAELAPLKLDRARFETRVSDAASPGGDGVSDVAFAVSTNPGAPAGPIDKIASGGELSRFLLALKVSLARSGLRRGGEGDPEGALRRGDAPTLIFDEIDRGVGGATADAVGARLRRLAHADVTPPEEGSAGQVLVVTHSAQVAAKGDRHWRIEKTVAADAGEERARTAVTPLDLDGRIDEIARMISGEVVSLAARVTAKTLIEDAAAG